MPQTDATPSCPGADPEIPVAIEGLHGWFAPGSRRRGVLLCGTYGFEQLCAYRSWRDLARTIAGSGCATLRLDYPGQGDSVDARPEEDEVAASIRAIRRGIAFLRTEAGADEIVLVGLRLGATLAALAAREGGVDRLALLAPFATGKSYLREMAMQARLLDILPDKTPIPQPPGSLLVGSFHLGADTLAALKRIDVVAEPGAAPPQVLLLGARTDALAAYYRGLGGAVETGEFPDLTQLVSDPLFARAPEATFAAVRTFACAGASPQAAPIRPRPSFCRIAGDGWLEETARFGPGLAGTLCEPQGAQPGAPAVLFVNSGRNVRSGQGRQTAQLARRLAAAGIASLRFDARGIGDSADQPAGGVPIYAEEAVDDVRAALGHLAARQTGPLVVLGTCSGGYLAFRAACDDARPAAAVLVNPFCFDLKPGTDVEAMIRDAFRGTVSYAARARQGRFWRRILSGEIRLGAVARAIWRDVRAIAARVVARLLPGRDTVNGRIARLRSRGARIKLVYSAGDMGMPALRAHLGSPSGRAAARLTRRLGYPVTVLDGVDHSLSMPADQDRLFAILMQVLQDVREQAGLARASDRRPSHGQGEARARSGRHGAASAGAVLV
ncbi:serine aminopeptidase domain-containing protein [Methylobacterium radiodurans]|uniref:serine aminopeptidase domain-containing protein n=1 Tax=Methylobacterium radiodurans TaxID=2202828 RepID=UPI001FEB0269|nr:alpha/beta hydrolase [Methylobacterium radiodurans]